MMFKRMLLGLSLLALLSLLAIPIVPAYAGGGSGGGSGGSVDVTGPLAKDLDPDVLIQWMSLLYDRVQADGISAPDASRLYAYAGITAYQSILPGIPEGISMAGQLTSLNDFPTPDESGDYDWPSSANAALATALDGLFPSSKDTLAAIKKLRASIQADRTKATSADVVKRSMDFGTSIGKAILDWASTDNFAETRTMDYTIPTGDPSYWVATAPDMKPLEPLWGQIRPFALYSADACAQTHKMDFSSDPKSTFYAQAIEVKNMSDNLTDAQKEMVQFWEDAPGQTGTSAGHWVMIETQVIPTLGLKLDRSAMMFALVGVSLGDSYISAYSGTYLSNLLSPVTYINQYIDPKWKPFMNGAAVPNYPSPNSVVASAAAEVLTGMFNTVAFSDNSGQMRNLAPRSYTSFSAAADEAAMSGLYGGVDFRNSIEDGIRQGQCVGQQVLNYVLLRSVPQGE